MEVYGGKFQKKREETRERILKEKISFIRTFFLILSLVPMIACAGYMALTYYSIKSWNDAVLQKTKKIWNGMDILEEDLMGAVLFLKVCRRDIVFQEVENGFQIHMIENRALAMEILQNVPVYSDETISAFLGPGVTIGDTLLMCDKDSEKSLVVKTIRSNPKLGYHYLFFNEPVSVSPDIQTNLIKFSTATYTWEKLDDGSERLLRSFKKKQEEVLTGIKSHKVDYSFKDGNGAFFSIDLTLHEKFPDGNNIRYKRNIPLVSFQRLPRELESRVP